MYALHLGASGLNLGEKQVEVGLQSRLRPHLILDRRIGRITLSCC